MVNNTIFDIVFSSRKVSTCRGGRTKKVPANVRHRPDRVHQYLHRPAAADTTQGARKPLPHPHSLHVHSKGRSRPVRPSQPDRIFLPPPRRPPAHPTNGNPGAASAQRRVPQRRLPP